LKSAGIPDGFIDVARKKCHSLGPAHSFKN
jgi:hypothetical protein